MKALSLFCLFISSIAFAHDNDITHRPKSFAYQNGSAVFVDMQEANYNITYDIENQKASVMAKIKLNVVEEGYPVFDMMQEPTKVLLDGLEVTAATVATPSNETKIRVINTKVPVGTYELEVQVPLTFLVEFTPTAAKSAFWVTDLEDRYYLERYIPVNLEYDRVEMTFNIHFKGLKEKQLILANGKINWIDDSNATIEFPEHFTVNSLYFHTTPESSMEVLRSTFKSIDGRDIPTTMYMAKSGSAATTLPSFQARTVSVLNELEKDYGAFPHASVTIYNASLLHMGLGGMEYSGATVTNYSSMSHELFHSYFARGVVPANGNAGWIDESLASWRDYGYQRNANLSGSTSMASHPYYTRWTDQSAYSFGPRFMAFLDNKFSSKGGLKAFMNKLLETKLFTPIFTEDFIKEMESFYGEKVEDIFKQYVYGTPVSAIEGLKRSDFHLKLSPTELQSLL